MKADDKQCELRTQKGWVPISLEQALFLDKSRDKRCIECGGQVQAHKVSTTGAPAHFEHKHAHAGCSLGDSFSGVRSPHPRVFK